MTVTTYEQHIEWKQRRDELDRQLKAERRHQAVQAADRGDDRLWWIDGLCRQVNPDLFFPEYDDELPVGTYRQAQLICSACPVKDRCLEEALRHDERFGVWGGTTPNDRRKLRRAARDNNRTDGRNPR